MIKSPSQGRIQLVIWGNAGEPVFPYAFVAYVNDREERK